VGPATTDVAEQYEVSIPAPDGRTVARERAGELWFTDNRTGRDTRRSRVPYTVGQRAWSPDGRWFLTTGAGALTLWDASTGRFVEGRRYEPGTIVLATFSPLSDEIHVLDGDGLLETLSRSTLQPTSGVVYVGPGIQMLVPHPRDGTVFAIKADGSILRVDPTESGVIASSPAGLLESGGADVAVSGVRSLLAATGPDGTPRLLDGDTFEWVSHSDRAEVGGTLAFAADGSQFASAQPDRIRLWDGTTGAYQASVPLPGPAGELSLSYLPDSTGLLVAATDGRVWTVDTRTSVWVKRACQIAGRNLTRAEWEQFFPDRRYEVTCPQWPAGA
jgi:WD40 repeat protein